MIKNDAGVLLSNFILQIRANKKEQFFDTNTSNVTVFRQVKYYDTVYRRIFYCFQTKRKEIYEVSFFETSSVLDEAGIFMNVSMGGAEWGQMKTC